jgi:hypothetical protein
VNVTRRQIRRAREAYVSQVRRTGKSTTLEMMLFEALDGLVRGNVIESDIERALAAKLQRAESMLEEVAALDSEDEYVTFTIDGLVRDDDGKVSTIFGTRDVWRVVNGSIHGDSWWERVHHSPYTIGKV